MSEERAESAIDLIRWTFTIDPARAGGVEDYLANLGLDVHRQGCGRIVATWEEPDRDPDGVIEGLWAAYGEPFEVTHEEFHRLNLLALHHEDSSEGEPGRAVA